MRLLYTATRALVEPLNTPVERVIGARTLTPQTRARGTRLRSRNGDGRFSELVRIDHTIRIGTTRIYDGDTPPAGQEGILTLAQFMEFWESTANQEPFTLDQYAREFGVDKNPVQVIRTDDSLAPTRIGRTFFFRARFTVDLL